MNPKGHLLLGPPKKDMLVDWDLEGCPAKVGGSLSTAAWLRSARDQQCC
jgi:hypothetical protein